MAACIYCKWHELILGEITDGDLELVGVEDCKCAAGHASEHGQNCSVFEANYDGDCPYFERADE